MYCLWLLLKSDGGIVLCLDKDPLVNKDKNMCYLALYSQKKFAHSMQGIHQNLNNIPLNSKFNLTESTCSKRTGSAGCASWNQWDLLRSDRDLISSSTYAWLIHPCITNWISNCISPFHPFLCSLAYFPVQLATVGKLAHQNQEVREKCMINKPLEDALAPACTKKPKRNQLTWAEIGPRNHRKFRQKATNISPLSEFTGLESSVITRTEWLVSKATVSASVGDLFPLLITQQKWNEWPLANLASCPSALHSSFSKAGPIRTQDFSNQCFSNGRPFWVLKSI